MEEEFGIGIITGLTFERAVLRTRIILRSSGFGILSEMDVPVTVGEAEGRKHLFFTAWQQMIAASNLGGQGLDLGDHLSVGIVVFEQDEQCVVAAQDPTLTMSGSEASLEKARDAIREVLERVSAEEEG